jgi:two-component system, NarL family, sensor kinase
MIKTPAAAVLERQNREFAILSSIATALNESLDLSASLGAALSRVAELLDLRTGWVWLLDETTGEPYLAATQHLPPGLSECPTPMEGPCFCLDTFKAGDLRGAANVNMVTCTRLRWLTEGTGGLKYHASIPLYARGKKLGVMNVASGEWRQLSADDLRLLHTIGGMLGMAIERAQLFERSVEAGAAEERNRLAREIHDTLAQGLSATALHLETAEALLEAGGEPDRVKSVVHRALEATRANLEEARRSVLDLRVATLEDRILAEALEELCTATAKNEVLDVRFTTLGAPRTLPSRLEVGLYRVTQEALAHVVRPAGARSVTVSLVTEPAAVTLRVEDDGQGFEIDRTLAGRFGLIGMRERLRLMGGELRVESGPGAGTAVEARVPLL